MTPETAFSLARQHASTTCASRRCYELYEDFVGAALVAYAETDLAGVDNAGPLMNWKMRLRIFDEWRRATGYRKRSRTRPVLLPMYDVYAEPDDGFERFDNADAARRAVASMRCEFVDVYLDNPDATPRELAEHFGVTPSAISHRLRKLRRQNSEGPTPQPALTGRRGAAGAGVGAARGPAK